MEEGGSAQGGVVGAGILREGGREGGKGGMGIGLGQKLGRNSVSLGTVMYDTVR